MSEEAQKILKLKELHESISQRKRKLEAKLEFDLEEKTKLEEELKEMGINPDELDSKIEELKKEFEEQYNELESSLSSIDTTLTDLENKYM